jgi:ankyrin repeat protein
VSTVPPQSVPSPAELKELTALCRAGKLFAVQEWLDRGQPYLTATGARGRSPFDVALDTGFHSLVEVFLRAGLPQDVKDSALGSAIFARRLELAQLLVEYGADPHSVPIEDIFDSRSPELIRWMISLGFDLETRWPVARALENRQRECLGIFMDLRDRVPSARRQAAMALRVHARDGNLKWVSLLLWAGADPRLRVPTRNDCDPGTETEEDEGTAVEDAVIYGQAEVLKKFKVDPTRDDVGALLCQCWLAPHPQIARMLLDLGADVNARVEDRIPIEAAIGALSFGLDSIFRYSSYCESRKTNALACIEVLAQAGARWNPADPRTISSFRRALGRADRSEAIRVLKRLVEAKALEGGIFRELMRTPKMRALLDSGWVGDTAALKRYAGFVDRPGRRFSAGRKRSFGHSG